MELNKKEVKFLTTLLEEEKIGIETAKEPELLEHLPLVKNLLEKLNKKLY